jgi:hypothetical protein
MATPAGARVAAAACAARGSSRPAQAGARRTDRQRQPRGEIAFLGVQRFVVVGAGGHSFNLWRSLSMAYEAAISRFPGRRR